MSKLKWTIRPSGYGDNTHDAGAYWIHPHNGTWRALYVTQEIAALLGSWQSARKACQDHFDRAQALQSLADADRDLL